MALDKLRKELEETIRQSRAMAEGVNEALTVLMDKAADLQGRRSEIANHIMIALQAQDRLEQRCANIEMVLDTLDLCPTCSSHNNDEIWGKLTLDELSRPDIDGRTATEHSGEVELF